ncbi:MAG TPA: acyltransferase [Abditibacteriaceae bacterium]|jgi:peptidoglycan/LPS O-acetylase OafA/YrhL
MASVSSSPPEEVKSTDSPLETSETLPVKSAKTASRLEWIDVFRGLAIVAVALIHTCGSFLSLRFPPDTLWYALSGLKNLLQFAVPAFLMLSSLVLTRSLLRDASLGKYFRNRMQSVLWPTIVWTLLCIPYAHWLRPEFTWAQTARRVWDGTSQYHLYFLRVLLQLCLVLPLLLPLMRRRPPLWKLLPVTILLTLAVFFANRYFLFTRYPASWLFWYIPSIALGIWLAGQSERWLSIARRGWFFALILTMIGGWYYLSYAMHDAEGVDVRTTAYPISQWIYVSGAGFLLFCIAVLWSEKPRKFFLLPLWRLLGRYSLQIYLLHPVILAVMSKEIEKHFISGFISAKLLVVLFMLRLIACIAVPLFLARLFEKLRLSSLLFGR